MIVVCTSSPESVRLPYLLHLDEALFCAGNTNIPQIAVKLLLVFHPDPHGMDFEKRKMRILQTPSLYSGRTALSEREPLWSYSPLLVNWSLVTFRR
jgi:hypothetical protein